MSRRTLAAIGLGVVAACAVAGLAGLLLGGSDGRAAARRPALPPPPAPALSVPAPRGLGDGARAAVWTTVLRRVTARAAPRAGAHRVARLSRRTPEGSANVVLVTGRAGDARGRLWVRVRLAVLPNGTSGWVPRRSLGAYQTVRTHLVVSRRGLTATLLRDGRRVFRAPVGVGRAGSPTPRGRFYIRNRLTRYRSPAYGPLAFGTSARSETLTDWPAGGYVGFTGRIARACCPGGCPTGASACATPTSCGSGASCPSGRP